jgi:enamine deaminase RidA (YjgF/YER057c/UK114 family)
VATCRCSSRCGAILGDLHPASTAVVAARLPDAELLIEVDAIVALSK